MKKEIFEKIKKAAIDSLKNPGGGAVGAAGKRKELPKKESKNDSVLYVFRHAQTYDNVRRIFSGRRQTCLTPLGVRQAKGMAEKLKNKKIDLFISSSLIRCLQTIKEIKKFHSQAGIIIDKNIIERDYGKLTGMNKLKLMEKNPEKTILWRRSYDIAPPGGESIKMVEKRVVPFCRRLEKKLSREKINIAVCCHNNAMRIIRMYFEKMPIEKMITLENSFDDYAAYVIKHKT